MSVPKLKLRKKRKKRKESNEEKFEWFEIFLWVPELLLYPLRLLWWIIQGVARFLFEVLNIFN